MQSGSEGLQLGWNKATNFRENARLDKTFGRGIFRQGQQVTATVAFRQQSLMCERSNDEGRGGAA